MTQTEALKILEEYQAWRRGADTEMLDPKKIGKAIDLAIEAIKRFGERQPHCKCSYCTTYP